MKNIIISDSLKEASKPRNGPVKRFWDDFNFDPFVSTPCTTPNELYQNNLNKLSANLSVENISFEEAYE